MSTKNDIKMVKKTDKKGNTPKKKSTKPNSKKTVQPQLKKKNAPKKKGSNKTPKLSKEQKAVLSSAPPKPTTEKVKYSKKTVSKKAKLKKSAKKKVDGEKISAKIEFKSMLAKIEYSFTDSCPFIYRLDEGYSGYKMKSGEYMNLFLIFNQDYENMGENDVQNQAQAWDNLYKVIDTCEIKFYSLNLPTDTRINQRRIRKQLNETNNFEYKRILKEMLEELKALSDRQTKQSYMAVYSDSKEKLSKFCRRIRAILYPLGLAGELSPKQKEYMFKKINNPYSVGLDTTQSER